MERRTVLENRVRVGDVADRVSHGDFRERPRGGGFYPELASYYRHRPLENSAVCEDVFDARLLGDAAVAAAHGVADFETRNLADEPPVERIVDVRRHGRIVGRVLEGGREVDFPRLAVFAGHGYRKDFRLAVPRGIMDREDALVALAALGEDLDRFVAHVRVRAVGRVFYRLDRIDENGVGVGIFRGRDGAVGEKSAKRKNAADERRRRD